MLDVVPNDPEVIMSQTRPGQDAKDGKDAATQNERDRSSAGDSGGAPATEEDIGTEGEGTEPRQSTDLKRDIGTAQTKADNKEDAR